MHLKLFHVVREELDDTGVYIAAPSSDDAAAIYITLEAAAGRDVQSFSTESVDKKLDADMQLGLSDMLSHGVAGLAVFDGIFGWCVTEVF